MASKSGIDYVDYSVNFWRGCRPVSIGCQNCYAKRDQLRYGFNPDEVVRTAKSTWNKIKTFESGSKVFVCPWSDFFIEDADEWRPEAWKIMIERPDLEWLIVTKRIKQAEQFFSIDPRFVYSNISLVATVCNQEEADRIIPDLLRIKVAKRVVSVEPMLGPVDMHFQAIRCGNCGCSGEMCYDAEVSYCKSRPLGIDQVIIGCESGPKRRECKHEWMIDLVKQCKEAGVKVFVKQVNINGKVSHDMNEWPEELRERAW